MISIHYIIFFTVIHVTINLPSIEIFFFCKTYSVVEYYCTIVAADKLNRYVKINQ